MNLSQFKPFKQYSFYDLFDLQPNIRERNPVVKRDPTVLYLRFSSNQEAIASVEGYFADLTKNHYRDGIMELEHRWNKCIILKGDHVEK